MQLYVQAWLLDKDGNRVKQNMAITIHHPEAMTDEKAEQLLESLKDELLQKWGDDYTLESDSSRGMSNVVTADEAVITVREGDLLLFHYSDIHGHGESA